MKIYKKFKKILENVYKKKIIKNNRKGNKKY